ncbi:GNAT family N-acetyltransferase [Paenibacillus hodogayensis]|uniref:GNAT family N-acetyltransferase n=1 Tax=Paenibacillus hodogayensis TaxID=279208 RepID=A0ABV5W2W0_9BACL
MYTCRPAQTADFPVISQFPQTEEEAYFMFPSGTYPLSASQLEERARERLHPTVVVDGDEVAGYANIYDYVEGKHCYLGNVIIAPAHRGRGAARFLLESMIGNARDELRVPRLLLLCHHTNPRAMLFYRKLGFKPFDLERKTNRRDEVIVGIRMELSL